MRKSSPGEPKPGRRQKPARLSQRISYAGLFLRPSAAARNAPAICRIAEIGQLFLPSPMVCSSLAGTSSGAIGDFAEGEKTASINSSDRFIACSLTTAAALRSAGASNDSLRSSNCRRQRLSLILDSHQLSSVPISVRRAPSFTGIRRSSTFLPKRITACSGACMCRPASAASNSSTCPSASPVRVRELYRRKETGRLATSCSASLSIPSAAPSRQIEIRVLEDLRAAPVPVAHHIRHALAQNLRDEESAVEENRVRRLSRELQEFVEVARHGRVGDVGQTQLAEQAALFVLRQFAALAHRQEAL